MRRKLLSLIMGGALSIAAVAPAAAATECTNVGRGGLASLVALVNVNVGGVGVNACEIDVDILNNSLNNLLRNADIDVLNNILNNSLNNSPILSNNDVSVVVAGNDILITVLGAGAAAGDTVRIIDAAPVLNQ